MGEPEDALSTYLNDHDAGAEAALGMIEHLRKEHDDTPVAAFLATLHDEVAADREVLGQVMDVLEVDRQRVKRVLANLAEKASRLQLNVHTSGEALSLLMGLDTLTSGVSGKLALWQALESLAAVEPRLEGFDFAELRGRAQTQLDGIARQRRAAAPAALAAGG